MQSFSRILSTVRDFYNEINPATLTGAIDVLVIEQPDGSYVSSPFYVRFGKMGVLRSREKIVDITINDQSVNIFMKLGDTGEAFFLERTLDSSNSSEMSGNECSLSDGLTVKVPSVSSTLNEGSTLNHERHSSKRVRWFTDTPAQRSPNLTRRIASEGCLFGNESRRLVDITLSKYPELPSVVQPSTSQSSSTSENDKMVKLAGDPSLCQEDMDNLERIKQEGAALGKVLNDASDWKYERHFAKQTPSTGWRFWQLGDLIRKTTSPDNVDQDGVYLNDLDTMTPSLASRYVSAACDRPASSLQVKEREEIVPLSPRSVEDPGYVSHPDSDGGYEQHVRRGNLPPDVALALCNDDEKALTLDEFHDRQIDYDDLAKDPSVVRLPNLVVRIDDKLYRGDAGVAQIVSLAVFNRKLSAAAVQGVPLVASEPSDHHLRPSPSFRRRTASGILSAPFKDNFEAQRDATELQDEIQRSALSDSELEGASVRESRRQCNQAKSRYKRTLRLDSVQLKSLPLVEGANKARFSVTTKYQGTCWCECHIFLWKWDDKLIISDIDGTITKSDVLGHILPIMGAQWTQAGVAELFNQIAQNGYRIVYLSARAIGQSQWTKDYLRWIKQDKLSLPQGPLLLSPTSLMIALHREVIEKKPEVFKTGCLMEIRNLFPQTVNPFYAGLGNRHNDVIAYTAVGVPRQRIFCINSSGAIESALKISSLSYRHLTDLADHFFPPLKRRSTDNALQSDFYEPIAYSSYNFWKPNLPELTTEELELCSGAGKSPTA